MITIPSTQQVFQGYSFLMRISEKQIQTSAYNEHSNHTVPVDSKEVIFTVKVTGKELSLQRYNYSKPVTITHFNFPVKSKSKQKIPFNFYTPNFCGKLVEI